MKRILSLMLISVLIAGCGIKRPLVLPGHEKKEQVDAKPDDNQVTSWPVQK